LKQVRGRREAALHGGEFGDGERRRKASKEVVRRCNMLFFSVQIDVAVGLKNQPAS